MKRHYTRPIAFLALLLLLCVGFSSCAASKDYAAGNKGESAPEMMGDADLGFLDKEENVSTPVETERKIIKTYHLSSETKSFDAATKALNELIAQNGGYVQESSSNNQSYNNTSNRYTRNASYVIRIPAENAEAFVNAIGGMLNVTSNRSTVEDISETYYSMEACLEELLVERDSLLEILANTETAKDYDMWLTVKSRLAEVKQQIAVYQGQLNRYDSQVAYSTIHLSINEVVNYTENAESNSFGSRLVSAFKGGWSDFAEGLGDFTVWLVGAMPTLLLLGLIATAIVLISRRSLRKKREKRQTPPPTTPGQAA